MNKIASDAQVLAVPVLYSADLRRSSVFYSDALGFAVYKEADGLRARRDEMDLKIAKSTDPVLTSNLGVVLRARDIRRLHNEFDDRVLYNLSSLNRSSSGKLQFTLSDPDGNSLYFVEDTL